MKLSRREAIRVSGTAVAGLSMGVSRSNDIVAQTVRQQEWPDHLVEGDLRQRADLPLNPDGSAPEYPPEAADEITGTIWRYTQGKPPEIEYDYRKMAIRLDSRGLARLGGTLRFSDLEGLPRRSYTTLLQCGAPQPTGIVKWTGVRFSDFAEMIEIQSPAHYCRVISHDGYWIDEDISTMMDPQAMLVWLMNDEAIPPINGAPLRLVIPFRYGARSIKAVSEITFGSPGLSMREPPSRG